jgi:hypothetical protein
VLSFANVYFFESGLFNGLQPIQIKNSGLSFLPAGSLSGVILSSDRPRSETRFRFCQGKSYSIDFCFCQQFVAEKVAPAFLAATKPIGDRMASRSNPPTPTWRCAFDMFETKGGLSSSPNGPGHTPHISHGFDPQRARRRTNSKL